MERSEEMKSSLLVKTLPFLTTFILLVLITLSNRNQNTKLKVLIWNTPKLSLGTYIAISTSSGFIISYLIMNNLAALDRPKLTYVARHAVGNNTNKNIKDAEPTVNPIFENTLIERDVRDPSPTINANFRVIGKINNVNNNSTNFESNEAYESEFSSNNKTEYYEEQEMNQMNKISNKDIDDWYDQSYSNW